MSCKRLINPITNTNPIAVTNTRDNWCQEVVGLLELLDLRVHHIVTAPFYKNGDATNDGTPAGKNGRQPSQDEGQ
jgi:hypothetical protein